MILLYCNEVGLTNASNITERRIERREKRKNEIREKKGKNTCPPIDSRQNEI